MATWKIRSKETASSMEVLHLNKYILIYYYRLNTKIYVSYVYVFTFFSNSLKKMRWLFRALKCRTCGTVVKV